MLHIGVLLSIVVRFCSPAVSITFYVVSLETLINPIKSMMGFYFLMKPTGLDLRLESISGYKNQLGGTRAILAAKIKCLTITLTQDNRISKGTPLLFEPLKVPILCHGTILKRTKQMRAQVMTQKIFILTYCISGAKIKQLSSSLDISNT